MTTGLADAHLHLFSRGYRGRYGQGLPGGGSDIEAYESLRAAHGIVAGLVVGYEADGIDPGNNAYLRILAATRPWMATLAHVELSSILVPTQADRLLDAGHAGIALYAADASASTAIAQWPAATWESLARRRAIVSLNARPEAMDGLAPAVETGAGCRFMVAHLGLPGRYPVPPGSAEAAERLAPLLRLARRANVFVKISGLYAVSEPPHAYPHPATGPFIDLLLDRLGPGRCLWGSDFSPCLDFVSFAQALSIPWLERLAPAERGLVTGGTLLRLLGRDGGDGAVARPSA